MRSSKLLQYNHCFCAVVRLNLSLVACWELLSTFGICWCWFIVRLTLVTTFGICSANDVIS